jgi:hypothetical protein
VCLSCGGGCSAICGCVLAGPRQPRPTATAKAGISSAHGPSSSPSRRQSSPLSAAAGPEARPHRDSGGAAPRAPGLQRRCLPAPVRQKRRLPVQAGSGTRTRQAGCGSARLCPASGGGARLWPPPTRAKSASGGGQAQSGPHNEEGGQSSSWRCCGCVRLSCGGGSGVPTLRPCARPGRRRHPHGRGPRGRPEAERRDTAETVRAFTQGFGIRPERPEIGRFSSISDRPEKELNRTNYFGPI